MPEIGTKIAKIESKGLSKEEEVAEINDREDDDTLVKFQSPFTSTFSSRRRNEQSVVEIQDGGSSARVESAIATVDGEK